jgi:methylated-DNA-[protein]-cysteine S-methyltransferase
VQQTLYTTVASPVGELLLAGSEGSLRGLWMQSGPRPRAVGERWVRADAPFAEARAELSEYFAGERRRFDLALDPPSTPFQRRVWRALREIPPGATATYGELARRLGRPTAARAVGAANALNPISIVIPCHRLVGANGALTGYAGGIERKRMLLELEAGADPGRTYDLMGADRRPYASALPGALGGHRRNRIYGRLDCAGARRWIAEGHYVAHRVFFTDEEAAVAAGYRPCANCMPEEYGRWKRARPGGRTARRLSGERARSSAARSPS